MCIINYWFLVIVIVKGVDAQDGDALATEFVAETGRGGGAFARARYGEGGRLEEERRIEK